MRFIRDSFLTLITQGATFALGAAASVVIARMLGPEGKGIYTLVFLLPALCISLGSLGLGAANVFMLRRPEVSRAGGAPLGALMANSVLAALAVTAIAAAIVTAAWNWIGPAALPGVTPLLAALGLASLPLALVCDYHLSLLVGSERLVRYNGAVLASNFLTLAAPALALLVGMRVPGAAAAKVLATAAAAALVTRSLFRTRNPATFAFAPDGRLLRRALSYGAREHVGNIAMFLSYRVDMFFVAAYGGARAVGIYSIAVMMGEVFLHLPNAVATVLFPRLAGRGREQGVREVARATRVVSALVGIGLLASIPLAAPAIRAVFSSAFLPAAPAFLLLLPGVYALSVSKVLSRFFTGTLGQPLLNARAQGVALAINLPLNVWLIPRYGIGGAAIASSAAYLAHAAVTLALFARHAGLPWSEALVPRGEDLAWLGERTRAAFAGRLRASHA
jgi:O-antigen/teichoic acid export membrane protein